jgi:hypothetical protein
MTCVEKRGTFLRGLFTVWEGRVGMEKKKEK